MYCGLAYDSKIAMPGYDADTYSNKCPHAKVAYCVVPLCENFLARTLVMCLDWHIYLVSLRIPHCRGVSRHLRTKGTRSLDDHDNNPVAFGPKIFGLITEVAAIAITSLEHWLLVLEIEYKFEPPSSS